MARRAMLIAGIACILSGVTLLCLWAAAWRILGAEAVSSNAADLPTSLPLPQIRQAPLLSPTGSGVKPVSASSPTGTPQPAAKLARPAAGNTTIYRVKPGDTLFGIALDFGVTVDTLVRFNNIADPRAIWPGQELVIPGDGVPTPARPTATRRPTVAATRSLVASTPAALGKVNVNGVPREQFVVISPAARQNIRKIYAQGQARGNDPRAFSKLGDSNMENPYFMAPFDEGVYKLGEYAYLQPAIDHLGGSFGRQSMAVRIGFHSWSVLDASLADPSTCWPDETPVGCEARLHNPSIALIRLGTNDAGHPARLREALQTIVKFCVQHGIIPILGTKADRAEGPDNVNNDIIRQLAATNNVPLWDFDLVAQTMPDSGLSQDHVHLTLLYPLDYTSPEALQRGHGVDNLTALIALDSVWREMTTR